uniref:Uncharacterized protein n=2 Tax=viral metagenome TaxID=1070528 RepID=A0A6H1ZA67_9ZZZZ
MASSLTARSRHSRGIRKVRFGPGSLTEEQGEALDAIRALAPEAVEVLGALLRDGEHPRIQLAACQEVLDRTYGRSEKHGTLQISHSQGPALAQSTEEQERMLVAALESLRARRADEALVVEMTSGEAE